MYAGLTILSLGLNLMNKQKKDETNSRPQINIKKLKNSKFKTRYLTTLKQLINSEKQKNGLIKTFKTFKNIIYLAGKSSLGISKQSSNFYVENKEIKKIRKLLNKYKK